MHTREIPRPEWTDFFDSFSREHAGCLVNVEILGRDLGAQVGARTLPLAGVSGNPGDATVWVSVGREPDDHITHAISRVSHVRLEQTEEGDDKALQIENEGGETTLVQFP